MKKQELPQDKSDLENFTREVCYIKNDKGKYQTELSVGWKVKKDALDNTWDDIEEIVVEAKKMVEEGRRSPIYYYMHLRLMNVSILAGYTGLRKFSVKRHFKPKVFKKLNIKKLQKYADAFNISVDELKRFRV
ncbi:hypothetical protein ACFL6I_21525 [candidate division KSB1 bacterium]